MPSPLRHPPFSSGSRPRRRRSIALSTAWNRVSEASSSQHPVQPSLRFRLRSRRVSRRRRPAPRRGPSVASVARQAAPAPSSSAASRSSSQESIDQATLSPPFVSSIPAGQALGPGQSMAISCPATSRTAFSYGLPPVVGQIKGGVAISAPRTRPGGLGQVARRSLRRSAGRLASVGRSWPLRSDPPVSESAAGLSRRRPGAGRRRSVRKRRRSSVTLAPPFGSQPIGPRRAPPRSARCGGRGPPRSASAMRSSRACSRSGGRNDAALPRPPPRARGRAPPPAGRRCRCSRRSIARSTGR